ncbi:hypothetical protein EOL96_01330 [Candidatus Saccharibacteria bacterium]|nr:hypothetical protein [Candidatus Saccharibacteria bacterium]
MKRTQRLEHIGEMAEDMSAVLQVTPEFIAAWAPKQTTYNIPVRPDSSASFEYTQNGVYDSSGNALTPQIQPPLEQLRQFRDYMPRELNYLRSREIEHSGPPVFGRITSAESPGFTYPGPFMENTLLSVDAALQLGDTSTYQDIDPRSLRVAERRTKKLANVVIHAALAYPNSLGLSSSPTAEQLNAAQQLVPSLHLRDRRTTNKLIATYASGDVAEPIDMMNRQERLRQHLAWISRKEYEARCEELVARRRAFLKMQSRWSPYGRCGPVPKNPHVEVPRWKYQQ